MKIKEIIELSKHETLEEISKKHLTIGLKRARAALKAAGCYNITGVKGWHYEGDPAILERSIYEFVAKGNPVSQKPRNPEVKQIRKTENQKGGNMENQLTNIPTNKQTIQKENNTESKKSKKVTYEIEEYLHDELKMRSIREKRNVSEIVNEILKGALSKL